MTRSAVTLGIDVGSLTVQAVLLPAAERPASAPILASAQILARQSPLASAADVRERVLRRAGRDAENLAFAVATGYGREAIVAAGLADGHVSEISCHATGAARLLPGLRTVIDIGGQDAKAIRLDEAGHLADFAMNDKCAAGTGHFLELMARTLEVDLAALGRLALRASRPVHVSSRCSAFAETEVLHFMQRGARREDVAAGIADALAERVAALARRVRPEPLLTLTGGVAKNLAVRRRLETRLGIRITDLPVDPQLVGALGAALYGARALTGDRRELRGRPTTGARGGEPGPAAVETAPGCATCAQAPEQTHPSARGARTGGTR